MPAPFATLAAAAAWYDAWLVEAALPLWAAAGRDSARGSFREALTLAGEPWSAPRRARVQTRQVWVYATAAAAGLGAAYGAQAKAAYGFYRAHYLRPDGLFARAAADDGQITDPAALLYEQAFSLLAMAALEGLEAGAGAADAAALRTALAPMRHPAGGFRETGAQPFQANAHMHLLEAALAWEETGAAGWAALADEIAELALARFIDAESGAIREFFDAEWRALPDAAGGLLEPGHQFEWAWLLNRWGRARGRPEVRAVAERLYATGLRGVDARGVAAGALWADLGVREQTARLWAQTEHLKAALAFGGEAEALRAAQALALYLETPRRGTWRDKLRADGGFVEEPAPATSFYHLVGAILPLRRAAGL
ncbi:AGE family epimerase/isomerase [Phenylobacterium sp. LjRoot219]|uniref:AGE family epimerase/isomerase n=1 Tax=Phenylobacterium sp. LjRoot219 TaxID=3342283 RepID=UPI003ECD328E